MSSSNGHGVRRALARAERGAALNEAEVEALLGARGTDLHRLLGLARQARQRRWDDTGLTGVVTYSPKVFIPLTRLCRDRCHYCTFVTTPGRLAADGRQPYLTIEEVVAIAEAGARQGCREALFTLGDRPEDRWPQARQWLAEAGYDSTVAYLRAAAIAVLERTGLLPHLNPGVLSDGELRALRAVAPSMGLMLETSSRRLFEVPGQVHHGSPDKDPAVRLATLRAAGRQNIAVTTGLLVGIGETMAERAQTLLDLRTLAVQSGHVQEVIVQNFRAKPGTAARSRPDADHLDYVATIAAARLVLPASVAVQAPPNLSEPRLLPDLLAAGIDDWGGVSPVTPDHVNPERPWPDLDVLTTVTADAGFRLRPRLTMHPRYVRRPQVWLDPRLHEHVAALADRHGLADPDRGPAPRPWQAPDEEAGYAGFAARHGGGRVDLHRLVNLTADRPARRGPDSAEVYGDWEGVAGAARRVAAESTATPAVLDADDIARALRLAADDPAALARPANHDLAVAAMSSTGPALRRLTDLADEARAARAGEVVTYVVNRNINFTNVCYTGCRFCAFAQRASDADAYTLSLQQVADRAREAAAAGATEVCMQGGIHPDLPGTAYFDLVRAVRTAVPGMHVHAFSPMEIVNGAGRADMTVREWLQAAREAGLGSIPGTAAEILDDDVRWILTKGKLSTAEWIATVSAAHEVGLPSTATMMYGHVDHPRHWVAHLRLLRGMQDRTGGFTEFVPLPFIHRNAPLYLAGVARPGPTMRDNIAVHAMARLMLFGSIDHIQTSWVKLGSHGSAAMLAAGVDDLGGTLMEETISRMAGAEHGSAKSAHDLIGIAAAAGRPAQQRSTLYGRLGPVAGVPAAAGAPETRG